VLFEGWGCAGGRDIGLVYIASGQPKGKRGPEEEEEEGGGYAEKVRHKTNTHRMYRPQNVYFNRGRRETSILPIHPLQSAFTNGLKPAYGYNSDAMRDLLALGELGGGGGTMVHIAGMFEWIEQHLYRFSCGRL